MIPQKRGSTVKKYTNTPKDHPDSITTVSIYSKRKCTLWMPLSTHQYKKNNVHTEAPKEAGEQTQK